MRKIRGRRGILEVDAVDAVFSQTLQYAVGLEKHTRDSERTSNDKIAELKYTIFYLNSKTTDIAPCTKWTTSYHTTAIGHITIEKQYICFKLTYRIVSVLWAQAFLSMPTAIVSNSPTQLNSTGDYGRRCKHLYVRIIMYIFFKKKHY